jgi:hypothetical protein
MLKNKFIAVLFLLCSILAGCYYPEGYKIVTEKDRYTVDVANYLTKTRDLSTTPSLQYHNRYRTVYLLIEDTHKYTTKESFEDYHQKIIDGFKKRFGAINITALPDTLLNGNRAVFEEITLKTDGENVWYYLATVETPKRYYQICSWTIERRKEKYENDIRQMVNSFKEL